MECPSCKADVRRTDKKCHDCGIDLQTQTHEIEITRLREENTRLKTENEALKTENVKLAKIVKDKSTVLP